MLDKEDKELNEMFHGEEKPLHPDTVHINLGSNNSLTIDTRKKNTTSAESQKPKLKPRDAEWEPAPHEPTQMEKVEKCAKSALLFGGLSLMFFAFQVSGQMTLAASMPCICACCVLMGWGVGKNAR